MFRSPLLTAAAAAGLWAQNAPTAWTPELSMQVQRVGGVAPSADGKLAAWTQTRAILEGEKSENLTHIHLWRGPGKTPLQLTRGEKGAADPSFSPDSKLLYFTSGRSGKKNIYRIALDGGEAEMITGWKGTLGAYKASPDGKWIAFPCAEQDAEVEKARKEKRDFKVIDEKPRNHGLWLMPSEADAAGKRAPKELAAGGYHVGEFRWSPDGRRIAFVHRPTAEFDVARHADISEVEVETRTLKPLAATRDTESEPRYSPDGRYLAFTKTLDGPSRLKGQRIALLDRASGALRVLPASPDENPQLMDWSADSSKLYFSEPKHTRSAIYALPVDGPIASVHESAKGLVGAGITNLWSMWGTNDIPSTLDDYFGGTPWDQPELYRRQSAIFQANKVKTPVLFLHGENDLRVPIGQAYEYYHALKRLGVVTKMVAYPRMPHGPSEPKFSVDIMQRHMDWADKYVK